MDNILSDIQVRLVAGKNQRNSFGKYDYRSCEDILEGLKPLLKEHDCSVILKDDIVMVGNRIYVKAIAQLIKTVMLDPIAHKIDNIILGESTAFAREPESQKGMNEAQITGSASSYARKYALNALFAIDDSKDADTDEHQNNANNKPSVNKNSNSSNNKPDPNDKYDQISSNIVKRYLESDLMDQPTKDMIDNKIKSGEWVQCVNLVNLLIKNHGALK